MAVYTVKGLNVQKDSLEINQKARYKQIISHHNCTYKMSQAHTKQSILVFSNGELIGDGMMKLPFIRALSESFPGAEITWLSGRHQTIFKTALHPFVSPYLHTIIDQTGFGGKWSHIWQKPWKSVLGDKKFDVIIDTERKPIPALMLKQIPHDLFVSAAFKWNLSDKKPQKPYKQPLLLVGRLLDLLTVATGKKPSPSYTVDVPPEWKDYAKELLADYYGKKKIVLLAPGAGGRFKCWPLACFIMLAKKLESDGVQPLFILGPAEPEWQAEIMQHFPQAVFPLQVANKSSPYLTIALGQLADVNVANDGGVGHILAASDQPTISLWGPTDPLKSTPNGNQVHIIKAQDFGGSAMADIPVDAVYDAVRCLLLK
ncbi:MAG: glycosyltransferase family 9 protein [Alphaproteobacteria bacterium]|nr:glycosyltransferase family 9 protein [Alphaproteobacteria bacterium]